MSKNKNESKPDVFFGQDASKMRTHSGVKSDIKSTKSAPFPITLYDDNRSELEELAKELAELTGRNVKNPNCSIAARAAITYALQQLKTKPGRQKLVDIYYRSGSRR